MAQATRDRRAKRFYLLLGCGLWPYRNAALQERRPIEANGTVVDILGIVLGIAETPRPLVRACVKQEAAQDTPVLPATLPGVAVSHWCVAKQSRS